METNMTEYSATDARANFSELMDLAIYKGPVVIKRRKQSVALVTLELLSALLEHEASCEGEDASEALKEYEQKGGISLAKLREELGMT